MRLNLDRWETHLDIRESSRHSRLRQVWLPTKAAPNEEWLGILLLGESERKVGEGRTWRQGGLGRVLLGGLGGHRWRRRHLASSRRRPTQEFPLSIDPSGNCLESLQYFFFLRPYLAARGSSLAAQMLRTNWIHLGDLKVDPSLIRLNFQAPRRNAPSKLRASVSISHYFVYNFVKCLLNCWSPWDKKILL